jgi:hypothetical protein
MTPNDADDAVTHFAYESKQRARESTQYKDMRHLRHASFRNWIKDLQVLAPVRAAKRTRGIILATIMRAVNG